MIHSTNLQSDVTILKLISKAKVQRENRTEQVLRRFRREGRLECPDRLFELRNGFFVGTGDYISVQNGVFYFCSANGSHKEVGGEFIYEFCRGCGSFLRSNKDGTEALHFFKGDIKQMGDEP